MDDSVRRFKFSRNFCERAELVASPSHGPVPSSAAGSVGEELTGLGSSPLVFDGPLMLGGD